MTNTPISSIRIYAADGSTIHEEPIGDDHPSVGVELFRDGNLPAAELVLDDDTLDLHAIFVDGQEVTTVPVAYAAMAELDVLAALDRLLCSISEVKAKQRTTNWLRDKHCPSMTFYQNSTEGGLSFDLSHIPEASSD